MNHKLNIRDYVWISISNILIILSSIIFQSPLILTIVSIMGVNYSYLIAKGQRVGYAFGFINLSLYAIYLLINKIYALGIYNLSYALPMCVYGYYYWSKKENRSKINELNQNFRFLIIVLVIFTIYVLYEILNSVGGDIPFFDAVSTCLSTLGTLLMSMKYKEQWPVWIIANFVNMIIWIQFTITDIANLGVFMMWSIYFINAIYGYYNWNKR